jgi:uncharacterized protein
LKHAGHSVHTLVRRDPTDPQEHRWNPETGVIDSGIINHVDTVINLSGASISKIPWTQKHKGLILSSRLSATTALARAINQADRPPSLLIQGSAVGFYGNRGNGPLTEDSPQGEGFLSDVVAQWEEAATEVSPQHTRVCFARTGLVIGPGGAMAPLRLQTLLGVGGKIGSGQQWWPWISLLDEVRAFAHLVIHETDFRVFNLVGPEPATAQDVTIALAKALKRPHLLGLPTFAINALLGEAGRELLLSSQKITPRALSVTGFTWKDQTIHDAIDRMVKRRY